MRRASAVSTLIALLCGGCVIPHVARNEIGAAPIVLDAGSGEQITDGWAVLLIRTRGAYLPDAAAGQAKLPRVRVVAIKELEKFSVADTELYVWPFFAMGSVYDGHRMWFYKAGYEPINLSAPRPGRAGPLRSRPMERGAARRAVIEMVLQEVPNEQWKESVERSLVNALAGR